jgi:diguanylate cyclase
VERARRRGSDLVWLVPATLVLLLCTVFALVALAPAVREPLTHATGVGFAALLAYALWCVGRACPNAPATRRFWQTLAVGLCCYALGMVLDLLGALTQALIHPTARPGTAFVFPIAGLIMLVAMFRYPTTAQTRGERLTVALDGGIVLLGSAAFLWYFSVSLAWVPGAGVSVLMNALAVPVSTLLAGFAVLKIAFLGTRVVCRTTLALFGASVACSIVGSSLQAFGADPLLALGIAVGALAHISAIVGAFVQYRHNWDSVRPGTGGDRTAGLSAHGATMPRRLSSVLPYGAVAAAFVLLFTALRNSLGWRQSGVLAAFGMLLCVVVIRQLVALRENRRLLENNERLAARLRQQAWYDQLTGLPNRAHYTDHVQRTLRRCRVTGGTVAMLLIDLDDFKEVNDTLGHAAGDELLRVMAERLGGAIDGMGTVFRLGGDEFVAIIEDANRAVVATLADTLVRVVAEPVPLHDQSVLVGASIGVRLVDGSRPVAAEELLRSADIAMYEAKAAGKGEWRIAAPSRPTPGDRYSTRFTPASSTGRRAVDDRGLVHRVPLAQQAVGSRPQRHGGENETE